jgi:hypothetical protein
MSKKPMNQAFPGFESEEEELIDAIDPPST